MWEARERRRFVRIPKDTNISYKVIPDPRVKHFLTKDISKGGIRFFAHEFIPKNAFLKVKLTIKKIYFSFDAVVKVVWIKEKIPFERYEVGVEFVSIPEKATEYLLYYINSIVGNT